MKSIQIKKTVLAVSIIVKNESKNLPRWSAAIQPLLNAVPSVLIITDTGSTDDTVAIAEKYTKHVLHFDWCDDFAAARQPGLDLARELGAQWFMFIDADEFIDSRASDISAVARFFTIPAESAGVDCALYYQRNYTNIGGTAYTDYPAHRIVRLAGGGETRFEGIIHEHLTGIKAPIMKLPLYADHYGYAGSNIEAREKRNVPLVKKEIKARPNNPRTHRMVLSAWRFLSPAERAAELALAEKCLDELSKTDAHTAAPYEVLLYKSLLKTLDGENRFSDVVRVLAKYEKRFCDFYVGYSYIDMCLYAARAYYYLEQPDIAGEELDLYGKLLTDKADGQVSDSETLYEMNFTHEEPATGGTVLELRMLLSDYDKQTELLRLLKNKDSAGISAYLATRDNAAITSEVQKTAVFAGFSGYIAEYVKAMPDVSTAAELFLISTCLTAAASRSASAELAELFLLYIGLYVTTIYDPALLNDDDERILPPLHRFGYAASKAAAARRDGDMAEYVRHLRAGLAACPALKDVVVTLLCEL